jgi:hypothetical protein
MSQADDLWSLPMCAAHLGITWGRAYNLLMRGVWGKPVRRGSRWYALARAVRKYGRAEEVAQ